MSSTGATGTGATGTGATGTDGATLSTATVAGGTVSNTTGGGPTCDETSLREAARCVNRPIGVALTTRHLGEAAYAEAAREFDYVTPEDEMKWDATEPSQGQFTYGAADQIVNFALENEMKVKGHTLVGTGSCPDGSRPSRARTQCARRCSITSRIWWSTIAAK